MLRPVKRRQLLGSPVSEPSEAQAGRIVCLSGRLEGGGVACVGEIADCVALSTVSNDGLVAFRRTEEPLHLRSGGATVQLDGQLAVVVGSVESARVPGRFGPLQLRALLDGADVVARGVLRPAVPETASYRSVSAGWALHSTGTFDSIDVAFCGQPRRLAVDVALPIIEIVRRAVFPDLYAHR